MILHTVNKAPGRDPALHSCLALARAGDGLLLLEDGVLGALDSEDNRKWLANAGALPKLYVLEPDLAARGFTRILPGFERLDYAGFVALCAQYARVQNWF